MRKIMVNFWKLNLLGAMEYRVSFIMQIIFMILSDAAFFSIWYFFFLKFNTIGGIGYHQMISLLAILVVLYAWIHIFFYGYRKIGDLIMTGGLDSYFLRPKNMLFVIMTGGLSVSAIGDLLYGIGLSFFLPNISLSYFLWLFILSFFGAIVFLGFLLIFQSLAFWIGSSEGLFRSMFEAILGPSHYPPGIFEKTILKYIFMSVIPVYYVAYLPYELLLQFNRLKFGMLILSAIVFFGLGYWTFYRGLKRYESGNAFNVNL